MANTVINTTGVFTPSVRDNQSMFSLLALAGQQDQTALNSLFQAMPTARVADFQVDAGTDTAAGITLLDFNARGVTFPVGTVRPIMVDLFTRNSAQTEIAWKRYVQLVVGGANPTTPITSTLLFNVATTAIDTELVADLTVQSNLAVFRLTTVPAAQFNHRVLAYVGSLITIDNTDT